MPPLLTKIVLSLWFVSLWLLVPLGLLVPLDELRAEEVEDAQVQQAGADVTGFDIWEYRVEGNSLLDPIRIERTVYPFLGPGKGLQEVESARQALEREFRLAGYPTVLVDIPEQDVVDGVIQLKVTEGKVDRLRISGSRYYSLGRIRSGVPALAQGVVPHLPSVRQQLGELSQESADRAITPVMRPGRTPGTLEVELKVKDELPLHGSLEINGRNSASTSRTRLVGSLRYDNLWQKFHSASLQYQLSPEKTDEVQVLAGTYVLPLGQSRNRLALYAIHSESASEIASAGALSVIGEGDIVGVRAVVPLEGGEDYFHSITLGADYKDFKEGVVLTGADTLNTPISYMPFSIRYDGSLRSGQTGTSFGIGATFGIRGIVGEQMEFENKRIYSRSNFFHLSGDLKHQRPLSGGYTLAGRLSGQLADSPLISNEQYGAGGAESVRGYYESQVLGDDGITGSMELQTPHLGRDGWEALNSLRAHLFVDGAYLRVRKPLPGNAASYDLASTGLGMRLKAWGHLGAEVDVAYPLYAQGKVAEGDTRVHFRVITEF